jgi:hypothetical protein
MADKTEPPLESIEAIRRIPFVRALHYAPATGRSDLGYDAKIDIQTPAGHFHLLVEAKRSFLTRSAVDQLLAWLKQARTGKPHRVILLARHIPRPVADRLIEAEVNFADDVGNIHLALGDRYHWTVVGRPASERASERRPISAAQLQLLFQFVTHPDSASWPVRRLELVAGISKSKAAQARQQSVAEGLLTAQGKEYQLGPKNLLAERLCSGYAQVLRPKLLLGRFRFAEKTAELFLARLRNSTPSGVRYALTGGPAADLLQHYYRGPEVPMFLEPSSHRTAQELRLLPDREGPVTLLRAFGEMVFWQQHDQHMLAPPWLIYAELLNSTDPRAHEAARELQKALWL